MIEIEFEEPKRAMSLPNRVFNYAKTQGLEVPFAMWVFLQGWGSGWRESELESVDALRGACEDVGVDTSSFDGYILDEGEGIKSVRSSMAEAEDSGLAGIPHYAFTDPQSGRASGLFGREHLALIRSKFVDAGLARHANVNPEFSHAWKPISAS